MSLIHYTDAQGTPEWRAARCGRVTASKAADVLATIQKGEAAARRDYRTQLIVERLTGSPADDGFVSADMLRGSELEPEARRAYEAATGELVDACGFFAWDDLMVGASPDGLVGADGCIELKVPKSATHLSYIKAGVVPTNYLPQIACQLWVTGRAWCDFASYDPRFPDGLRLFVARVTAEQLKADIEHLESKVRAFLEEVDKDVAALAAKVA